MIEKILPPEVAAAETCDDPADAVLFPEEEAVVARAVGKRRREFTTARWCARRALAELGLPPVPIIPGERGEPGWPEGVVGSITHCDGYRAAAVAMTPDVLTVGIDAEPHHPLPDGVLNAVAREEELALLGKLGSTEPGVCWDRLLFSVKESVYKAWFPMTGEWLGFQDASLIFDPAGTFNARLLVPGPVVGGRRLAGFTGRWLVADGLVTTAIVVPGTAST